MIKPLAEPELLNFIQTTHAMDRVDLPYAETVSTYKQQSALPNPYAQGHLRAYMYAQNTLLPSNDFPAKNSGTLSTIQDSETALFWLREIHTKMVTPLLKSPLIDPDDINMPTQFMLARYRIDNVQAVARQAPPPDLIRPIMYNWLKKYSTFHELIKDKIDNPYGIDKELSQRIFTMADEVNYFFCIVQPMACLNQRIGRFLELIFRMAWHLPVKSYKNVRIGDNLLAYETNSLPAILNAVKDVR